MIYIPVQCFKQMLNKEFLPQGKSPGGEAVMVAAGKKPHQAVKAGFIQFFGRIDAGRRL